MRNVRGRALARIQNWVSRKYTCRLNWVSNSFSSHCITCTKIWILGCPKDTRTPPLANGLDRGRSEGPVCPWLYSQRRLSRISGDLTNHFDEIRVTVFYTFVCLENWDKGKWRLKVSWLYNAWRKREKAERNGEIYDIFLVKLTSREGQSNKISKESQLRPFWLRQMI